MSEILGFLDVNDYGLQSMVAGAGKMQDKTATPTTSQQIIEPDQGYDGMSSVTVNAVTSAIDENIIPTNIRSGKTILGVQGNLEPDKPDQSKTVNPSTSQQVVVADTGYELAQVTVNAMNLQSKDISISTNGTTTIEADQGYDGLSDVDVTVSGILDTSDATANAGNIQQDKTAYVNGVKLTGTLPTATSKFITNQSVSNMDFDLMIIGKPTSREIVTTATNVVTEVPRLRVATAIGLQPEQIKKDEVVLGVTGTYEGASTSKEEKDVNFYDYDGTVVESYTKSEFLALQSMPANPTHEGLTAQGWNWSLADAQDFVTNYDELDIGQLYVTNNGATRLYIHLKERLDPVLQFAINGTAIIDWGDNSATEQATGTSISQYSKLWIPHQYATEGDYCISITSENPIYFTTLTQSEANGGGAYFGSSIKKIEIGNNMLQLEFISFYNLETITIPTTITSFNSFRLDFCLKALVLPPSITTIPNQAFRNCSGLRRLILPKIITSIGSESFSGIGAKKIIINADIPNNFLGSYSYSNSYVNSVNVGHATTVGSQAFYQCTPLEKVKFGSEITSIGANAFAYSYPLSTLDFSKCIAIPTIESSTFSYTPNGKKIIVPDALYEDWIVANNWSSLASQIVKASEA